jgi:hypothetical protein
MLHPLVIPSLPGFLQAILLFIALGSSAPVNMSVSYSSSNGLVISGISDAGTRDLSALALRCSGPCVSLHYGGSAFVLGAIAFLSWTVRSSLDSTQVIAIAAYTHLSIGSDGSPPCDRVTNGFTVGSSPFLLTFLTNLRGYFTHETPRFWFGDYSWLESFIFSQTSWTHFTGDSAMSISWSNIYIHPGETVELVIMARWGDGSSYPPQIVLTSAETVVEAAVDYPVSGTLSHSTGEQCYLLVVVDQNKSIMYANTLLRLGDFNESVPFSDGGVGPGIHTVSFYAVTELGTFSDPCTITLRVLPGTHPPKSRTRTGTETATPVPPPSPTIDTRMPVWQVGLAGAAALIIVMAATGRFIFCCCNFLGKHAYYEGSEHSSSYSGHGNTVKV